MAVAQLVERSLPTPEIRGLNPVISKILSTNCIIEKTKIKKKRPGNQKTLLNLFELARVVVVVQLAERSLPTPDIPGSNPDIGKEINQMYLSANCYPEKTKIKKKRPGMAH